MEDVKKVQPSSSGHQYEVFLSFRGPDTRAGVTDFLYTSLRDAGVYVYRDDEELRVGEEIGPELLEAINQSKVALPVFSKNYASSKWCLKELAQMVHCRNTRGQKILPIFYDVEPNEVRHQTGNYADAFLAYEKEKRYSEETIKEWKTSLAEVGKLKGWDVAKTTNRHEGEFVKLVVKKVLNELRKAYLLVTDTLVGMDCHVQKIMDNIKGTSEDTRYIGIHGMGGVGKTTLAKIIYNQLSHLFEECCFLANVREVSRVKGIEVLQNQLISTISRKMLPNINNSDEGVMLIKERLSSKNVLILVDDVDHEEQLRKLVGGRGWFGVGSTIIITTRIKSILRLIPSCWAYEIPCLEFLQSMKLFSIHAFRKDCPPSDFAALSNNVVKTAGGLPLSLQVIGSYLCGKDKNTWIRVQRKLREIPHQDVRNKLKISYDMLEPEQKQIFLDIACFFIGKNRDLVLYMWEDCYPNADLCLEDLEHMSLIKINENNNLWMHDQLKDLGRSIVQQENIYSMYKSRLWHPKKAADVLVNLQGTEMIEAIFVKFKDMEQLTSSYRRLINLRYLRFLHVGTYHGQCINNRDGSRTILPSNYIQSDAMSNTLPNLRWLSWHHLKVELLMLVTLSLRNLVILDLSETDVDENWLGWQKLKMAKKLKVLDLSRCLCLKVTPDLSGIMSIERLIFHGCENVVELHCSVGQLKSLVSLNLEYCKRLCQLPEDMSGLVKLRELLMNNCGIQRISEVPDSMVSETPGADNFRLTSVGYLKSLSNLDLSATPITQLSASIGGLTSLEVLNLRECVSLTGLPDEIGNLVSLVVLDVTRSGVRVLPSTIGNLKTLRTFNASFSKLEKLSVSIGKLQNLEELNASCSSLQRQVPRSIARLSSLRTLRLSSTSISVLPTLPSSLTVFCFGSRTLRVIPDLSNLTNLKHLELRLLRNNVLEFELVQSPSPSWIGKLQKLEFLVLSLPHITILSPEIGNLTLLRNLCLFRCKYLQELTHLPPSLSSLVLSVCPSLRALPDLSPLQSLSVLLIAVCGTTQINGLEKLRSLGFLVIIRFWKLQGLPDLSELNNLREMLLADCPGIVEIRGRLEHLEALTLINCLFLERLPVEHFVCLEKFHLVCCPGIKGLEDIREYCYDGQEGINHTGTLKDVLITADKNARNLYLSGFLDGKWKSVFNQE